MRRGTVALSPSRYWTKPHKRKQTAKMHQQRMMRQLLHAYSVPPHCRASRRQMTHGMRSSVPTRSKLSMNSLKPLGSFFACSGSLRKRRITAKVTPPKGRLIQKHHPTASQQTENHPNDSSQDRTPGSLVNEDAAEGRRDDLRDSGSGTNRGGESGPLMKRYTLGNDLDPCQRCLRRPLALPKPTIKAPVIRPAAPTPETARPTMRTTEFGAAAHTTDPTSKMASPIRKIHLMLYSA